jgi:DNA-binding GntR family transcriptional regulator
MPPISHQKPYYLQVRDYYADLIATGELPPGSPLPTVRDIAAAMSVSHQTAARAMELLRGAGLIETTQAGSVVAAPRLMPGPQQQLAGTRFPASHLIEVTAAALEPAPAYIAPILGLLEARAGLWPVIRREQVHYGTDGLPFLLAVSWFPPELAEPVPALTSREPVFGVTSATHLIGMATGRMATHGKQAREARPVLDDGREGPLLRLDPGYVVLAETYWWRDETDVLEYGEYILRQGLVTTNEYAA